MNAKAESVIETPPVPLTLHRVRFALRFSSACGLPRYPGSAIRGLLGHGLRKTLCVTRQADCKGCQLLNVCGYARFFESPAVDETQKRRFSAMPHGWVLDLDYPSPRCIEAGQQFEFRINLMGDMAQSLPWLVMALQYAGELGFGREHVPFSLAGVWHETTPGSNDWQEIDTSAITRLEDGSAGVPRIPAMPRQTEIRLLTPLRMKRQGKLVTPQRFSLETFLGALRLRLRDLVGLYGLPDASMEFPDMPSRVEKYLTGQDLRWQDWTRYSNRQRTTMQLGGLVGALELDMQALAPWWPILWFGQWLHAGKQTSMGLGQYRLVTGL